MRRLTVVQLLPALASGGVERTTIDIASALAKAGHRSIVVSAGGRLVDELQAQGSEHFTLDIGRKSPATLRHVLGLRRLFLRLRPDIVHARSRLPAWLGFYALKGWKGTRPHFLTSVHGLNSPGAYSRILTRGERVVCVSGTVRAHVLEHWPETLLDRLLIIEPGIDSQLFAARPARARHPQKLLLMPGRGTRLKGHAAAIRLLAGVRAAGVDARLWFLGTREPGREAYIAELEALAATLGVGDFVETTEPTSAIAEAYERSDLVLQLSTRPESFGRTVLEALCCGRPVVGWAHGGVGELLARHYPEGQVRLADESALLATTLQILDWSRTPAPVSAQTLADMQAQTLKLYESVIA